MPHSSGGGSHSGGHHSSSHHSSYRRSHSSSSASAHKISSSFFKGAKKYVYYVNNKPEFIYSNYNPNPKNSREKKTVAGCSTAFMLLFALVSTFAILASFQHAPDKLFNNYDTSIVIQDDANIISNQQAVIEAFERFYEETGITPALKTLYKDEWSPKFQSLEKYAFALYLNLFKDEKHWLIVYSADPDLSDGFNNWEWEGMQGDDTDSILSSKESDLFNKTFQKCLLQTEKYSLEEALITSFDTLTPVAMKKYIPGSAYFYIIAINLYVGIVFYLPFIIYLTINSKKTKKYRTAVECPEGYTDQETCSYCQGIYIAGLHEKCPHCGAQIAQKS